MKKGWEIKKLVDVCVVERGSSPRPIKKFITDNIDGVNWIKIGDTKKVDKYIYSTKQKITKEGAEKSRYVKEGDFILSNSMSFGKPYIMKTTGYIHDGWFVLRLHDFIDTEYFFQLLSSPYVNDQFHKLASGSVVKNISGDLVKKVILPIPPLPEQQAIVAILDKAFAAIATAKANAEQNLKNALELFESYLQGVFERKDEGWEENVLGEIAFVKSGGTPSRAKKEYWENGDIAWYSSGELNDLYTKAPDRHINKLAINNSNAKLFPKGSLLIGMYDTAALKMSIIDRNAAFNQAIAGIEPNDEIDLIFVLHSINSIKSELLTLRRGVRQKNLSLKKIKNIPIFLPPLKTQQTIVKKLDALSAETKKLETIYQQKIVDLEELKKAILQKAFNGELKTEKELALDMELN